ncbi:MAG TPA: PASTA domain-containing protein, partial [Candidatus Hydrogenedens sp.]|nr:PASTA domain-containing protein [Candidatus Hydrogenedens sp.]
MSKSKFLCLVVVVGMLTFSLQAGAESLGLNFCDSLQKVLENSLLEGVDLGEFQYFLDMFQPNTMDMNGTIYVDLRTIPIPNVAGLTEEQAKAVLKAWGFNVVNSFYTPHPTVPEGQVIRTDPGAEKRVIPGSDVRLRVSTGVGDETSPPDEIPRVEFVGIIEGNGMLDIANEFGLIQAIGNDESFNNGVINHEEVYNAWMHNLTQFQTDMGTLLSSVLPGMIPGIQEIFLAYLTLGDGDYTIYSKPVPNQFDGYMNGGAIFPPTPSIGKGFIRMNQTTDGTNITGMSFDISLSDITGTTGITAVKVGEPAFEWWSLDLGKGDYSFSYTITPEQLAMIDTTKIFPNDDYWNNFYIIVKTLAYPDGEIGIQLGDLEPGSILAEGNGSFGIIAGLIALLDDMLRDLTREELGTEMGFDNPYLNRESYIGLEKLLP